MRYRMKKAEREAFQFTGDTAALANWILSQGQIVNIHVFPPGSLVRRDGPSTETAYSIDVEKSAAECFIKPGDFVIIEPDGKGVYPCEESIFMASYEPIT